MMKLAAHAGRDGRMGFLWEEGEREGGRAINRES